MGLKSDLDGQQTSLWNGNKTGLSFVPWHLQDGRDSEENAITQKWDWKLVQGPMLLNFLRPSFTNVRNKLECLSLASICSLV